MTTSDSNTSNRDVITYIFPDFNAVKYFQRDFIAQNEFHIIEETKESGVDIYLVEQWVNNRKIGTIVSTFTGNPKTTVSVIKFTVIKKLSRYYPTRFQEYLNELILNHAKVKRVEPTTNHSTGEHTETSNVGSGSEVLFVTNLTTLPSNLNLIPILSGDPRTVGDDYVINSNLKKLHCSGRSLSLITEKISVACEDKFRQMYKIYSMNIPVKFAIKELINLIQTCLFYFDLLDARYCDGLLCSKTEEAIINWWNFIGLPHFNIKPSPKNGILPARAVAAIISFLISVKLRLQLIGGCDVPKDPFDFENFMLSIGQFQKQYKLEKRRKLDLDTLSKLFSTTNSSIGSDANHNVGISTSSINYSTNSFNKDLLFEDNFAVDQHRRNSNPRYDTTNSPSLYTPNSTGGMSSYRKNKNYYSKELKKLTNVVKNTVQDHISAVNRDEGSYYNNQNGGKSNGIRRNKLSKLSELSPIEVETLDLELLVKNFLTGKRLIRLWYGNLNPGGDIEGGSKLSRINLSLNVSSGNKGSSNNHHGHHHSHHHHSYGSSAVNANSDPSALSMKHYKFVSLKDEITATPYVIPGSTRNEYSRYSRGFNKMKLGLPGRKSQLLMAQARQQLVEERQTNGLEVPSGTDANSTSLVDSLLQITAESKPGQEVGVDNASLNSQAEATDCNRDGNALENLYIGLSRRNSYPSVARCGEVNLNIIEFTKRKEISRSKSPPRRRSASFSLVESYVNKTNDISMATVEKLSADYLRSLRKLNLLNQERIFISKEESPSVISETLIKKLYGQLNLELIKLCNVHSKMQAKKIKIVDENLFQNLDNKIFDLTSTIDRLVYETRIVVKRMNELEENSNTLELNLNQQCLSKLTGMINKLTHSSTFYATFSDENERNDIILRLTGKLPEGDSEREIKSQRPSIFSGLFQFILLCVYEAMIVVFQMFKFDRSRMNLDRIRNAWARVDPNRKYIDQAYAFLGRKPSASIQTAAETTIN
ncbi:hypothetical protein CAAN1_12S04302 [[Candida] anglica]|uniref:STB6-like N-terminal domain-containing protein n=1 Tax=[Candida] anglica TaxID=148631 RepID=A0ABP0E6U2_9ASCO